MRHCMVDLETLSTQPDAAILSIGAVIIEPGPGLTETFYEVVELQSCLDVGLRVDASTVYWWLEQSESARLALLKKRVPLDTALQAFAIFYAKYGAERLWGHGSNFDEPILRTAFARVKRPLPWKYRDVRDTRTLYELKDFTASKCDDAHNALADAAIQGLDVLEALRK